MAGSCPGVAALDRVEAILRNPELYELAALIPQPSREKGGRSRDYPDFMYLAYEALISVYASARQVEAELAHKVVWKLMRRTVKKMFPDDESMRLPSRPMRRHHYLYGRNRYLSNPAVLEGLAKLHRELAAGQARELGLMDPEEPGSWTHPHLSRMLYSDGKVITPLYKTKAGDEWVDKRTGEIKQRRYEPDADLHFEGTGEVAYGTKFVLVAVRSEEIRGRMILDLEWVPDKGGEAKVAMGCFQRLHPLVPGAQGVIYDTALRGTHHQVLLREMGLMPVNRVTAAVAGSNKPRRAEGRRVEKSVHVEDREIALTDGCKRTARIYARGGAIGLGELTDKGELDFVELPRMRTHRNQDASGLFRWYNEYVLPELYGGKHLTVRLYNNDEDAACKFNRTENVRPIASSDPDFKKLYARRSDSESINRGLEDTLYLNRAHSVGHARQHVNLLGYALMVNSLALHEHRQRRKLAAAA
ncbi:MAG TPA: hypothetical protein VKY26_04770 [Actinomycetota bacterium]|nr:hypothetical protein [Actinomycetota bacterium]